MYKQVQPLYGLSHNWRIKAWFSFEIWRKSWIFVLLWLWNELKYFRRHVWIISIKFWVQFWWVVYSFHSVLAGNTVFKAFWWFFILTMFIPWNVWLFLHGMRLIWHVHYVLTLTWNVIHHWEREDYKCQLWLSMSTIGR